jgi:hypothetical protein
MGTKKTKSKVTAKTTAEPNERDPLREAMESDHPEAFRFKDGDMIVGKVVRFGQGYSQYGPHAVVIVADETDGELRAVHCLQTVLRNQMVEADPRPGDRIAVKCLGKASNKSGTRRYENFRVRVETAEPRSFGDVVRGMAPASAESAEAEDDDNGDDMPF